MRSTYRGVPRRLSPASCRWLGQRALWAAVMQGLVMQNDFRGGNIPIVGYLETGLGRCQRNLEQLRLGILPSLTKPLSDVARKERLYLLGTSAIAITTIVFTGLILLRRASSQRKGERSAKRSKTTGEDSMLGWGKKKKPKKKKKRNVPDVEIHVPELDIDRLEITLENLRAHVDVEATIGRPGNEFLNISIGVNARIDSAHIMLEDVEAEAHVIAFLDDVRVIAVRALEVLDHHPEILTGLVDVPIPDPEPVGAKGLQEPAERDKEDNSVHHQALDRGRAMLQRWGRTS